MKTNVKNCAKKTQKTSILIQAVPIPAWQEKIKHF